jgi:hypothetical protein
LDIAKSTHQQTCKSTFSYTISKSGRMMNPFFTRERYMVAVGTLRTVDQYEEETLWAWV